MTVFRDEAVLGPVRSKSRSGSRRALAVVSVLLVGGIAVGADIGIRIASDGSRAIASDTSDKLIAEPLGPVQPTPMVSEPYRPDRLKDFVPPTPIAEPTGAEPETGENEIQASNAAAADAEGRASCSSGTRLEQDICADPRLRALDVRISSSLDSPADPRYREYLSQRETWCGPQPSRANRQECLLDLGRKLLSRL